MTPDEEYAAVLLRPLSEELSASPGPSTVDISRALTDGRRRRRNRRRLQYGAYAATAVVLVTALGLGLPALRHRQDDSEGSGSPAPPAGAPAAAASPTPSTPAAPKACTVEPLAIPQPSNDPGLSFVRVDPSGRYIVGSVTNGSAAWIWTNRVPHPVTIANSNLHLRDINSAGVAVGTYGQAEQMAAFTYTMSGGVHRLLANGRVEAVAINESGRVVGNDLRSERPVIWRDPEKPATPLPVPASARSATAFDLDDDGTAVGEVNDLPYAWLPDGTGMFLALPPSGFGNVYIAERIRNGWVTGRATQTDTKNKGPMYLTWKLPTTAVTEKAPPNSITAVNGQGWLVGTDGTRAVLTTTSGTMQLPDPPGVRVHVEEGEPLSPPTSLSDASDGPLIIVGSGTPTSAKYGYGTLIWICQ